MDRIDQLSLDVGMLKKLQTYSSRCQTRIYRASLILDFGEMPTASVLRNDLQVRLPRGRSNLYVDHILHVVRRVPTLNRMGRSGR